MHQAEHAALLQVASGQVCRTDQLQFAQCRTGQRQRRQTSVERFQLILHFSQLFQLNGGLDAVLHALTLDARVQLLCPCLQNCGFGGQLGFMQPDQRIAGFHLIAVAAQQLDHLARFCGADDGALRHPHHPFGKRVGRQRYQQQESGQAGTQCRGEHQRTASSALQFTRGKQKPEQAQEGQQQLGDNHPDGKQCADHEKLFRHIERDGQTERDPVGEGGGTVAQEPAAFAPCQHRRYRTGHAKQVAFAEIGVVAL